jgi:hypothetical protein
LRIEERVDGLYEKVELVNNTILPAMEKLKTTVGFIVGGAVFVMVIIQGLAIAYLSHVLVPKIVQRQADTVSYTSSKGATERSQ